MNPEVRDDAMNALQTQYNSLAMGIASALHTPAFNKRVRELAETHSNAEGARKRFQEALDKLNDASRDMGKVVRELQEENFYVNFQSPRFSYDTSSLRVSGHVEEQIVHTLLKNNPLEELRNKVIESRDSLFVGMASIPEDNWPDYIKNQHVNLRGYRAAFQELLDGLDKD